jgi:ribonuclease HI
VSVFSVFCDGSITGGAWGKKTGPRTTPHGWYGWVIYRDNGGVLKHHSADLGEREYMTGNIAEYMGLRSALKWLKENRPPASTILRVFSDSQLVINQMTGKYNCYDPKLILLRDACRDLARAFVSVHYEWIPREQNQYADHMSKVFQTGEGIPPEPLDFDP